MTMDHKEITLDILKVFGIHVAAITITISDVESWLKITSLAIAISYGIWKWRTEYLKHKRG